MPPSLLRNRRGRIHLTAADWREMHRAPLATTPHPQPSYVPDRQPLPPPALPTPPVGGQVVQDAPQAALGV